MTRQSARLGEDGERVAERWLRLHGWRVLERRFRSGRRDIDLIAERDRIVAFVEVKARTRIEYGDPVEAVNWKKRQQLAKSAYSWIERFGRPGQEYRFDVIAVLVDQGRIRVRHVENAFGLLQRS